MPCWTWQSTIRVRNTYLKFFYSIIRVAVRWEKEAATGPGHTWRNAQKQWTNSYHCQSTQHSCITVIPIKQLQNTKILSPLPSICDNHAPRNLGSDLWRNAQICDTCFHTLAEPTKTLCSLIKIWKFDLITSWSMMLVPFTNICLGKNVQRHSCGDNWISKFFVT